MARATARIGWTHRFRGTPEGGIAAIQPVLEVLSWAGPSQGLASLHLALAYLHYGSGRYQESLEAAEQAAHLARAVGDERLLGGAEVRRGTALNVIGQLEEGTRVLKGSVPLLEAAGDLETLAMALNNLGDCSLRAGELKRAKEQLERAIEAHERVGNTANIGFVALNLAEVLTYLGEWGEAEVNTERGAAILKTVGASWYAPYAPLQRVYLRLRQGRWEEAARDLQEAIALAEPVGDRLALEYASWLQGELEVLEGRAEVARKRLRPLATEEGPYAAVLLMTLAWACLMLEDLSTAGEAARRGLVIAEERQERLYVPELQWVQGMILFRQERWEEARHTFEEAIALAHSMPYPYSEGRTLYQYALLHRRTGEFEQAEDRLQQALSVFRRLGARKDVEAAEQALAELTTV